MWPFKPSRYFTVTGYRKDRGFSERVPVSVTLYAYGLDDALARAKRHFRQGDELFPWSWLEGAEVKEYRR